MHLLLTPWMLIALLAIVAWLAFRFASFVSVAEARRLLRANAKVIDVRSRREFDSGHVKGAINIPLEDLARQISAAAPDKSTPLLLHCLSGGRSAVAKQRLRSMGYTRCFNLGSLGRARNIVETP